MKYTDLRDFVHQLEARGELKRVTTPISPRLELTELADRVLRAGGPALLIEHPADGERRFDMPVLANLFGTPKRVALGMGEESTAALRELGKLLAYLKEPEPPKGLQRCLGQTAGASPGAEHGAARSVVRALPAGGLGGRRGRSRSPAGADLLARRRGRR